MFFVKGRPAPSFLFCYTSEKRRGEDLLPDLNCCLIRLSARSTKRFPAQVHFSALSRLFPPNLLCHLLHP
jgi:hypothetical protein